MYTNLCPEVRGRIVGQWQSGKPVADIAADIPCSIKTVRRWIQRFTTGGDHALHDHRKHNHRPRRTTQQQDEDTKLEALHAADTQISGRTARKRLNEVGYRYRPAPKIPLTPEHREQRVAFSLENLTTNREEWEVTIWTDKKVFVSCTGRQLHVWQLSDQRLRLNHVIPTPKSERISCTMWGWISGNVIGELVDIPTKMNSAEYIRIMEEVLLPSVRAKYPVEKVPIIRLMQNNSGVHTSRETQEWFRNHPEIHLIKWPARSPDLNLMENVWTQIVQRWEPRKKNTVAALIDQATELWEELRFRPDFLANLLDSIPNRLNQIIDRNGYWTDY